MKLLFAFFFAAPVWAAPLTTLAERSQWKETGRYQEAVDLCHAFAKAYPGKVKCESFGKSPEGRTMVSLVVSGDGTLTPELAKRRKRAVILLQGGIHAGEIDGKDAGFLALRELLDRKALPGALGKATVVFVPVFNVDGHERFGKWNRPNQVGPEQMGWRTTAQNLNLNRDYMKAEAPEMAAMIRLLRKWDPALYVDLHVTDGADFQVGVSLTVLPSRVGPETLVAAGDGLRRQIIDRMTKRGHLAVDFYPSFRKDDDPTSGFEEGAAPPRFAHSYWALHNRLGLLVETHSWKDYPTRVKLTHDSILEVLDLARTEAKAWAEAGAKTESEESRLGRATVALSYEPTETSRPLDFPGYAYRLEDSSASGGKRILYDSGKPQVWKVPFFFELRPKVSLPVPSGGYLVPSAHAQWVAKKLELHGIRFEKIGATKRLPVLTFRATDVAQAKSSYEGRSGLVVQGQWNAETREVPKGSLFVPIDQPLARLAMHLFEPQGPDSFVSWGYFNPAFERKEYMEAYVAEQVAETMLKDEKVRAEFEHKLSTDKDFAASAEKRLDFFYEKHPSWDEQYRLYPVYRATARP